MAALSEGERHLCEWRFGMASHFVTALFAAICYADQVNINRMSVAFPDEVNAFTRYKKETGYWQRVEAQWRSGFQSAYLPRPTAAAGFPGAGPDVRPEGDVIVDQPAAGRLHTAARRKKK